MKAGLTRELIIQAAAELADEAGLAALSLAELAGRLGVKPPSLYNHVGGLPDIQRLLTIYAGRVLTGAIARATVGKSRDDAVMAMAQAHRAFVKQHPGLATAVIRAPAKNDQEAQQVASAAVELCLSVLHGYGLEKKRALHVIRAFRSSVHGFATLEVGGGFGLPLDVDESFVWMAEALIRSIRRE